MPEEVIDLTYLSRVEVVEYSFDPDDIYVASSESPAYWVLRGLVEAGSLELVGEDYDARGQVVVAVRKATRLSNPTIGVSSDYFQTVLRDYEDWRVKWWREVIQNSVDAGATRLVVRIDEESDGSVRLTVEDNGRGMDADTMLNKFLVLGGTTKKVGSTVGGFGKAKELLLLPWVSWQVESHFTRVRGRGIEYEVEDLTLGRSGVSISVVMPSDNHTGVASLEEFLLRSRITGFRVDLKTYKNGQLHEERRLYASRSRGRLLEEGAKADFYVRKSDTVEYYAWVRVNGLFMFQIYVGDVGRQVPIIELKGPSVQLLTANRDGFRDRELRREVDLFVQSVMKDSQSRLARSSRTFRKIYRGTGLFHAEREAAVAESLAFVSYADRNTDPVKRPELEVSNETVRALLDALERMPKEQGVQIGEKAVETIMRESRFQGAVQVEHAVKTMAWTPDFYLLNEIEDKSVERRFYPEHMTPGIRKVLRVWAALCKYVLVQLGAFSSFGVGFHFSRVAQASYSIADRTHWFLLNPFRDLDAQKGLWRTSNFEDLKMLYALAIHEVTHMADGVEYHDEAFATALTANIAKTADGVRKIRQIARHA